MAIVDVAIIEFAALTIRAGGRVLIRDLSLRAHGGELWVVLGPNGSGKTSLLLAAAGLRAPFSGQILLGGDALPDLTPGKRAERVGILFQDYGTPFPMTALDAVTTGRHRTLGTFGQHIDDARSAAYAALDRVGLAHAAHRTLDTLSGGERRRVELAAVLTQETPLLLLDEPLNHLDPSERRRALSLVRERQRQGHAVFLSLHDIPVAARMATHALAISGDGRWWSGTAGDILVPEILDALFGDGWNDA